LLSMKPEQIISDQSLDLQKRFKYYQEQGVENINHLFWLDFFSERMGDRYDEYRDQYPEMWKVLALNSQVLLTKALSTYGLGVDEREVGSMTNKLITLSSLGKEILKGGMIPVSRMLTFGSAERREAYCTQLKVGKMVLPKSHELGLGDRDLREVMGHTQSPSNKSRFVSWTYAPPQSSGRYGLRLAESGFSLMLVGEVSQNELLGTRRFIPFDPYLPEEVCFYFGADNQLGSELDERTKISDLVRRNKMGSVMTSESEVVMWGGVKLREMIML
jgi:hypothetical protein